MNYDLDQLVETITKEILKRLNIGKPKPVLILDGCPSDIISGNNEITTDQNGGYGYVLMTSEAYQALTRCKPDVACEPPSQDEPKECTVCQEGKTEAAGTVIDLSAKRLLHERDIRDNNARRGDQIKVSKRTIITALAHDYAKSIGIKITQG